MAKRKTSDGGEDELKPGVLITLQPKAMAEAVAALSDQAGVTNVAYAADFEGGVDLAQTRGAGMTVFNDLV